MERHRALCRTGDGAAHAALCLGLGLSAWRRFRQARRFERPENVHYRDLFS